MNKVYFILGIHNHQPVGNFPEVLEMAYQQSYLPFLTAMERHPSLKWSLHASGILWDFFRQEHPDYVDKVTAMAAAGRLELISGGYYEPIMSVIPDRDKKGQIRKMTTFLSTTFGKTPRGMWLAERVWEPGLVKPLAEAGVTYTVVDDAHFAAAGMDVESLRGYYVTEDQGVKLNIFPISQRLRYSIPFEPVKNTIEYLGLAAAAGGNPVLVMADDGEKFGLWPETYKHVYEQQWLEQFLTALEQNKQWIETTTFSEYLDRFPPAGRIYLPTASYFEMSEWTLPAHAQEEFESVVKQFEKEPRITRFLKGGFWRNFLTKYPESNTIHKRMLEISNRLENARQDGASDKKLSVARNALYAGQCNCAYWHGVFGGLYLPHLRTALYRELISAGIALDAVVKKKSGFRTADSDCDGNNEILYESKTQNLYFAPFSGGTLYEWDIIGSQVNLLNVLSRRPEAYHQRLREFLAHPPQDAQGVKTIHDLVKVKEQNLDQYLHYDWHRRVSLIDHFLHPATQRDDFKRAQYGEQGDFVLGAYDGRYTASSVILSRTGTVWDNDRACRIRVEKTVTPRAGGMKITYVLENHEDKDVSLVFAPEYCFAFSFCTEQDDAAIEKQVAWTRKDDLFGLSVDLRWSSPEDIWVFPLETVSLSESGFERTYQGTVATIVCRLVVPAKAKHTFNVELTVHQWK
ncbi:MAG: alpha-amylase/4-alpha-glucanotransferase domain-containing protein [Endomicrobiales bacterium]|jgi:alpha-amylase